MNKVCVLVIAHKEELSLFERNSLLQCFNVLSRFPIFLICPEGLDVSEYRRIVPELVIVFIDSKWQSSYLMFNRLKLSSFLYNKFNNYDYLLFYELDSWVFRDELDFWCDQGYDYIGAPWIGVDVSKWLRYKGLYPLELRLYHKFTNGKQLKLIGNGGFSLRKTKSMIFNTNLFSYRGKYWQANEDSFFAHYVATFNKFFKIPDVSTALKFSFDVNPEQAFDLNEGQLPFGCHGFCRSDSPNYSQNRDFWDSFIQLK